MNLAFEDQEEGRCGLGAGEGADVARARPLGGLQLGPSLLWKGRRLSQRSQGSSRKPSGVPPAQAAQALRRALVPRSLPATFLFCCCHC